MSPLKPRDLSLPDPSSAHPAQGRLPRGLVAGLGAGQLILWGVSYYLITVFAGRIGADLGWTPSLVHGGFTAALLVMGAASAPVGRLIDSRGGRPVMVAGSVLTALGCGALAAAHSIAAYYAAWALLGVAMRASLYDAAFAALVRAAGDAARRPISRITLLGGLASSVFWPLGDALADRLGWRTALLVYAALALLTVPLHLRIPAAAPRGPASPDRRPPPDAAPAPPARGHRRAAALYALVVTLGAILNAGVSAHTIGMLTGLGLGTQAAVWASTLRGVGQSSARLAEVASGGRLHPVDLNVLATGLIATSCAAAILTPWLAPLGLAFAALYGAGNGLSTIARGTLPLVLFDRGSYGTLVGKLLAPGFYLSAFAPLAYAALIERASAEAAVWLTLLLGAGALAASLALRPERR